MSDSNGPDHLAAKHEGDREQRMAAIKRWIDYIESNPPAVWGPQQNAIVDDQLEAAQQAALSAEHQQRVREVAEDILEATPAQSTTDESPGPDE